MREKASMSKKIKKNIIIVVLSFEEEPWLSLEKEGIRKTWGSNAFKHPLVEILFYYGGRDHFAKEGDRLYAPHPEGFSNIGKKTIDALDYINNHYDYDFVFRTNSSSYVDIRNYLKYIYQYDSQEELYCGLKCVPAPGDPRPIFASGCGYTLSHKTVNTVLDHRAHWDHQVIDDNAIAKLLRSLGVAVTNAPRLDYSDRTVFTKEKAKEHFHIRCKCEEDRQEDIARMQLCDLFSQVGA